MKIKVKAQPSSSLSARISATNTKLELLDGFVPADDVDFQIFDAGSLSGTFSAVLLPDLPGMLGWDSSHLYRSGTLSVIPAPTNFPLPALGLLPAWRRR